MDTNIDFYLFPLCVMKEIFRNKTQGYNGKLIWFALV